MSITKGIAYKTTDGTWFDTEQGAKDHEFEIAIREWWDENVLPLNDSETIDIMIEQRMKLLTIWKLLNGGSTVIDNLPAPFFQPQPQAPLAPSTQPAANATVIPLLGVFE